ncbi:MAG TPA: thioredoxin domain-containing protein [Cytophagaceae bacterium]|nr:thioredoxin domain-containing protein [Cytophagaceae bacterium]
MKPNKLINESSPYLLQHAHNPVQWYPWGEEALKKAKEEDKPIIVSIGYSACHWCHVMERECFEKEALAAIMNEHFINIKVDREERPDIDQIYMDAVQAMGLQGGWPLNVFLTPDTNPFYGGTYFPPAQWENLLGQIDKAFKEHREDIEKSALGFRDSLSGSEVAKYNLHEVPGEFLKEDLDKMFEVVKPNFDTEMGGNKRAPKFPMPSIYSFLLRYYSVSKNKEALQHAILTLDKMAYGGIYDQIGGGFARYSTDMDWFAPHFEKMLYDNGQLLSLYTEAYQATKDPNYKTIVYETIEWLKREMTSTEGGFYSALDADSEGEEGKFYVWYEPDLKKLLGEDAELFSKYYNVNPAGNWENIYNILIKSFSDEVFALNNGIELNELQSKVKRWKEILLKERDKRVRPGLDDKILASWNGLMLKGLADAYRVFDELDFLKLALDNASFLKTKMKEGEKLFHNYKNGKATIDGYLEDYAFVIDGYLSLYEATFDEQWINEAIRLTNYVIDHFYDEREGLFFFTADNSEKLIARKKEIFDNVIPASNSAMARNMYKLSLFLYKDDWKELAESMLSRTKKIILTEPSYLSNWACLYADLTQPTAEIAISGRDSIAKRKAFDQIFLPNKIMAGMENNSSLPILENRVSKDDKTMIYVCYNKTCQRPVEEASEALKNLN